MFVLPVLGCHEEDVVFRSKWYCSSSREKYFESSIIKKYVLQVFKWNVKTYHEFFILIISKQVRTILGKAGDGRGSPYNTAKYSQKSDLREEGDQGSIFPEFFMIFS